MRRTRPWWGGPPKGFEWIGIKRGWWYNKLVQVSDRWLIWYLCFHQAVISSYVRGVGNDDKVQKERTKRKIPERTYTPRTSPKNWGHTKKIFESTTKMTISHFCFLVPVLLTFKVRTKEGLLNSSVWLMKKPVWVDCSWAPEWGRGNNEKGKKKAGSIVNKLLCA